MLPQDTALACLGEQLIFMCNTNATSLRWNVTVPLVPNGIASEIVSHTQTRMISPIRINSDTSLTISRLSTNGTLPLISTLSVNNVISNLNGTKVECFTRINDTGFQMVTTIHVISGSNGKQLCTSVHVPHALCKLASGTKGSPLTRLDKPLVAHTSQCTHTHTHTHTRTHLHTHTHTHVHTHTHTHGHMHSISTPTRIK